MVAQLVLGILASIIVNWYSRRREFRADRGGAELAGTGSMIGALEALKRQPRRADAAANARIRHQQRRTRWIHALVHEPSAAG